jgi:hypothetical protein
MRLDLRYMGLGMILGAIPTVMLTPRFGLTLIFAGVIVSLVGVILRRRK